MSDLSPREAAKDDGAVNAFAAAMREKLKLGREKGKRGWETIGLPELRVLLHEAVEKGDPVDIGNYAMMIHHVSGV